MKKDEDYYALEMRIWHLENMVKRMLESCGLDEFGLKK